MWRLGSRGSGLDFMEENGKLLGNGAWGRRDDLIKMVCEESESGRGRTWGELRLKELNSSWLECEVPTGHLSKLQKATKCLSRAQEVGPAGLALHVMVTLLCLLSPSDTGQVTFLSLAWVFFALMAHEPRWGSRWTPWPSKYYCMKIALPFNFICFRKLEIFKLYIMI